MSNNFSARNGSLCIGILLTILLSALGHAQTNIASVAAVPLLVSASDPNRQGFVRIIATDDGIVRILPFDDSGMAANPVEISLDEGEAFHFNAGDLEDGNPAKGIAAGIGRPRRGDWRLGIEASMLIQVLAYVRTNDGFLTAMHDRLPRTTLSNGQQALYVSTFNPASNTDRVSKLRLINSGEDAESVSIQGFDDQGKRAGPVRFSLDAGQSRTLSADDLETGNAQGLSGNLGDGAGKWILVVAAGNSVHGVSLLDSASGHLSNISTRGVLISPTIEPTPSGDDHGNDTTSATNLALGGQQSGRIDPAGDKDYFRIQVTQTGTLTVYTTGEMDTFGRLFDSSGTRLTTNDDGGASRNFRIEREVDAGTYYAEVTEFGDNDTGSYTAHAEFAASTDPEPPTGNYYGAYAWSRSGGWGVAFNHRTQTAADNRAIEDCEERRGPTGRACTIPNNMRFGNGRCLALYARQRGDTDLGYYATAGRPLSAVEDRARQNCENRRGTGETCVKQVSGCNRGSPSSGIVSQTSMSGLIVEGS